eukprot:TRINITY_DN83776_c0_g1_i1.p1 TRINITY_DN83776_c0_g1~~TRINITY_DN83776_c0_g1_i1.p1  ORF type:complete len:318 (+),score=99.55 TRINITY_DN83776_c0_g1_i1:136-1089(+)
MLNKRQDLLSAMDRRRSPWRGSRLVIAAVAVVSVYTFSTVSFSLASSAQLRQRCSRPSRLLRRYATKEEPQALQGMSDLNLIKSQVTAGQKMRELGASLLEKSFEASALDGKVKVAYDGLQELQRVDLAADAAAGGGDALQKALLGAMQEAHDNSLKNSGGDVWELYRSNPQLMQAPLNQIGAGNTVEDLWVNVTQTPESVKLAEELFAEFDEDKDGYWNLAETSKVQKATEGTDMAEEAFNSLIIAAAPDGGRKLSEEDMAKGLSKQQVIELYTSAEKQRQLGFVLNIFKDHDTVFKAKEADSQNAEGSGSLPMAD